MSERVIVIDPGERTGWVRAVLREDGSITDIAQGVHTMRPFVEALYQGVVVEQRYDTVVYETWRLFASKAPQMIGNEFTASQIIGCVRMCAWLAPHTRIASLTPRSKIKGRAVMPDVLSRRLKKSSEEHDKDALDLLSIYHWRTYRKEQ